MLQHLDLKTHAQNSHRCYKHCPGTRNWNATNCTDLLTESPSKLPLHATLCTVCSELKSILSPTLGPGSGPWIVSALEQHSLLVSKCSQAPFSLKKERKFPVIRPIFEYHNSHYLCVTSIGCLGEQWWPSHPSAWAQQLLQHTKANPLPAEAALIIQEKRVAGTRHWGRDAKGFYHYASETQKEWGQLCSTSVVLGWVKAVLFF